MSLTSFLDMPDVMAKVKPLRPKLARKITQPLKVEPRSNHYSLVGTAFDYLLRFELQRQSPHALSEEWIAEDVPDMLWQETHTVTDKDGIILGDVGAHGFDLLKHVAPEFYMPPKEVGERARRSVAEAKAAVAEYVKNKTPTHTAQTDLAAHAIRLAKLDPVFRAGRLDPRFDQADAEDVQDLIEMLAIVPFNELLHPKLMLLNPNFQETSQLVGGGDTDLITGDLLVDFKATKTGEMRVSDLDQLLGYFLLARKQRQVDSAFPPINRLGLYFCRHGYLWSLPASVWTDRSEFLEIEQWFFKRATETFSTVGVRKK